MPGRVIVQWDKEDCADLGLIKVDLLGLGMMAALKDSITLIRNHYDEEVDLAKLPADDPLVYDALQKADTVGLFQVESRAQMSSLPRLKPANFYDIVVQVAIIRPGRQNDASLLAAQGRRGRAGLFASKFGACAETHPRRPSLSGTASKNGDDCCGFHRRGSGRTAPCDGI
jgi:hypothetical protein